MAGQPDPPILQEAFAVDATVCTQTAPVIGGKVSPFPVGAPDAPGGASLATGWGAANMTDPTAGGVPPFGIDFNGLMYLVTAILAALAAGQQALYNSTLSTAMSGYRLGALLLKSARTGFWFNLADGNTTNPDSSGTGWLSWTPVGSDAMSANLGSGTTNNWSPTGFGASIGFLGINPNIGTSTLTGLAAGINGQTVTITNIGANNLTLSKLNGGSSSANQFLAAYDSTLQPNMSITLRYSTGVNQWIVT
jgi:hypothetical protein